MALSIVRYKQNSEKVQWGLLKNNSILPIELPCTTTAELLSNTHDEINQAIKESSHPISMDEVILLSPITTDAKVLCQGANYRQHMIDSGIDPDVKIFNMFFTKSSASIHTPYGNIIQPKHVELLDYEIELALVLGKKTNTNIQVTSENLHEYIAGICIANDISARDIQIPQMQFHKGKSYRTFCPLGPILYLINKDEMHYLDSLQLNLTVNGEVRQNDNTKNLVFKPAETLTELSKIADFHLGDVVLTGTPSGCALGLPSPTLVKITSLLPENKKWDLFLKSQKRRSHYLKIGDLIQSKIFSLDGQINLGQQNHTIIAED